MTAHHASCKLKTKSKHVGQSGGRKGGGEVKKKEMVWLLEDFQAEAGVTAAGKGTDYLGIPCVYFPYPKGTSRNQPLSLESLGVRQEAPVPCVSR